MYELGVRARSGMAWKFCIEGRYEISRTARHEEAVICLLLEPSSCGPVLAVRIIVRLLENSNSGAINLEAMLRISWLSSGL